MSGENLENHVDVKHILVEMGTYFQVQARMPTAISFLVSNHSSSIQKNMPCLALLFYLLGVD